MKYTVKTPNKNYSGVLMGLTFARGEAQTDDKALAERMAREGYDVSGVKMKPEEGRNVANAVPLITEVRVALTDPDGHVRGRSVAVVGGINGNSDGPDWTTAAEAEPTDPVAAAEARGEYASDAEAVADKVAEEAEKLAAAVPDNVGPEEAKEAAEAEAQEADETKDAASDLPDDFPARSALMNGKLTTLEAVRSASDAELEALDGIGAKTVERIREALK